MKLFFVLALVIQATITFSATPQDGGTYKIIPKRSGLVLGLAGNSNNEGTPLIAQPDFSQASQRFILHQTGPNVFELEDKGSGLYIIASYPSPSQALYTPGATYHKFELFPVGSFYMIRAVSSVNFAMTLVPGSDINLQPITGADNQLFYFCSSQ